MKKHLLSLCLSALASVLSLSAQSFVPDGTAAAGQVWTNARQAAERSLRSPGYDSDRRDHDCDRCKKGGKGKKSRKHDRCSQPGNHHGKHKNRDKGDSCCCGDSHQDRSGRNRHNHDDEDNKWYGQGQNDRGDEGYRTDRSGRNTGGSREPQVGQRRPSSEKVKSRRTPGSRPTTSGAKQKAPARG